MRVLAVSAASFSGDDTLAQGLAESLGYRLVEPQAVVERAAAWGVHHDRLWAALSEPPRFQDGVLRKKSTHLLLLRAALAEEVRTGGAVCQGNLGELLPRGEAFLLRIRVHQPLESRINTVQERLKLSRTEAVDFLRRLDKEREAWLRYVHGRGRREAWRHEILIDLDRRNVAEACEMVAQVVRSESKYGSGPSHLASLEDFALSCRVRAALALAPSTAHLDLDVAAENGLIAIDGMTPRPEDASEIQRVAGGVPGVGDVLVNGDRGQRPLGGTASLSPEPGARPPQGWKPRRSAWVVMSLTVCLTIVFSWSLSRLGLRGSKPVLSPVDSRTFTGVITDTVCGATPGMDAGCIRACVKSGSGAKYALFDGKQLYTLSDQLTPEKYAGQQVRIVGVLDAQGGGLKVESIKPAL